MGLFNFLYKLTNIFSNKRKLKVFIVLGIILFIVFSWSRGAFASTAEDDLTLLNYQIVLQDGFIDYLQYLYTRKPNGFDESAFNSIVYHMNWAQIYVEIPTSTSNCNYEVYFYNPTANGNSVNMFTVTGTWSIGLNSGTQIDCMLGDVTMTYSGQLKTANTGTTPIFFGQASSKYIPASMFCVRSNKVNDFLKTMGYMSQLNPTYATHDQQLQAVMQSGFSSINNNIDNQTNQMTNSINSASTSITNSVNNLTNTITDTTTDDSQVEFAQDTNQDITSGFFTGLYNSFQTAFTDNSYKYVQFPIPFTGKVITFSSNYVLNNIKNNQKFSVIVSLAEAFWWFALGYFVILDIYKKINAIKSGDLTNIENDNITTDLL